MSVAPTIKVDIDNSLGDHVIRAELGAVYSRVRLHVSESISEGNGSLLAQLLHQVQTRKELIQSDSAGVIPCETPYGEEIFDLKYVEIVALLGDEMVVVTSPDINSQAMDRLTVRITAILTTHSKMRHAAPKPATATSPSDLIGDLGPLGDFLQRATAELQRPHQPGDNLGRVFARLFGIEDTGSGGK